MLSTICVRNLSAFNIFLDLQINLVVDAVFGQFNASGQSLNIGLVGLSPFSITSNNDTNGFFKDDKLRNYNVCLHSHFNAFVV